MLLYLLLFLNLIGCGVSMSNELGPLKLSGDQYWKDPSTLMGKIELDRIRSRADGMLLDAPDVVYLDIHPSIPLICHRSGESRKLHQFSLNSTAQIVVSHLETGKVLMVKLGESPDRVGPEPSPGWATEFLEVDLLQIANLGPKLGQYAVRILCGPESSNLRYISIYPSSSARHSKDVREQLMLMRSEPEISSGMPEIQNDKIRVLGKSQLTPESRGVEMNVIKESDNHHKIRVQFQVAGLPRFEVASQTLGQQNKTTIAIAYLPVGLFVFNEHREVVVKSTLNIPAAQISRNPTGESVLDGAVSIEVPELEEQIRKGKPLDLWISTMSYISHFHWRP